MQAIIQIKVYGGSTHLATLNKHFDLPAGLYSERPLLSEISLTPAINANVKLRLEAISLKDNGHSLLVSDKRLQVSEILQTVGAQNFGALVREAEQHGWEVEKYIDGINQYFHIDQYNSSFSSHARIAEEARYFCLFMLMAGTPALALVILNSGFFANILCVFVWFYGVTAIVYFLSFGAMQYMKTRGEAYI